MEQPSRQYLSYEFGLFRTAATVSGGLIVSYRLIESLLGTRLAIGEAGCLRKQVDLRNVKRYVLPKPNETVRTPVASIS